VLPTPGRATPRRLLGSARDLLRLAVAGVCLITFVKAGIHGDLPSAAFMLIAGAWLFTVTTVEREWSNRVGLAFAFEILMILSLALR
jgi:hypothetical protein